MPYPYYPQSYPYNQYNTQQYQQMQQPQMSAMIRVQSENEARNYPVAPGNSVPFVNENEPYIYVKTASNSQLGQPKFERYRITLESDAQETAQNSAQSVSNAQTADLSRYALKSDVESVQSRIEQLNAIVERLSGKKDRKNVESEVKANE